MDKLLEGFLQYVSLDTQSKPGVRQVPSTEGQWKLLRLLQARLQEMGLVNVTLSEKGTIMGTLPANVEGDIPAIGFISHVDTSPDFSGKNVNPQIVENYRGGDIALGIGDEVLSPVMFPILHQLLGQTLITTDGKTLLGADDKAGIAEIMTALATLKAKNIPHGDIRVAFTPDEEVGKGAKHFDVAAFDACWAYTVDGGGVGELEFENFNAGLESVDSGQIHLEDHDITHIPAENRHVNTVFQSYALFPHMTVFENVAFGLRMQKTPTADIAPRVHDALRMVQLEAFAQRKPHQL
ncbi:tripeptide aminopeptidase PepT, partial [Klebsiella michiganensis]